MFLPLQRTCKCLIQYKAILLNEHFQEDCENFGFCRRKICSKSIRYPLSLAYLPLISLWLKIYSKNSRNWEGWLYCRKNTYNLSGSRKTKLAIDRDYPSTASPEEQDCDLCHCDLVYGSSKSNQNQIAVHTRSKSNQITNVQQPLKSNQNHSWNDAICAQITNQIRSDHYPWARGKCRVHKHEHISVNSELISGQRS